MISVRCTKTLSLVSNHLLNWFQSWLLEKWLELVRSLYLGIDVHIWFNKLYRHVMWGVSRVITSPSAVYPILSFQPFSWGVTTHHDYSKVCTSPASVEGRNDPSIFYEVLYELLVAPLQFHSWHDKQRAQSLSSSHFQGKICCQQLKRINVLIKWPYFQNPFGLQQHYGAPRLHWPESNQIMSVQPPVAWVCRRLHMFKFSDSGHRRRRDGNVIYYIPILGEPIKLRITTFTFSCENLGWRVF